MAGQDESKQMAILSAANLTDHALEINSKNTKALIEIIKTQEYIEVPRQEAFKVVYHGIQIIIMRTVASTDASARLVDCLNDLAGEIFDTPDVFYAPLAQQYWIRVLQAINIAIQQAGSKKEEQFMQVLYSSLSNINFAREKVTIPKMFQNLKDKF